ncbi:hypothetical protein HanRHA438_Chr10g0469301 [Helianthus annuus]|nr:hypothetical protein HanRHA438_Chr10g0469301 [Helianthus annuus]
MQSMQRLSKGPSLSRPPTRFDPFQEPRDRNPVIFIYVILAAEFFKHQDRYKAKNFSRLFYFTIRTEIP